MTTGGIIRQVKQFGGHDSQSCRAILAGWETAVMATTFGVWMGEGRTMTQCLVPSPKLKNP